VVRNPHLIAIALLVIGASTAEARPKKNRRKVADKESKDKAPKKEEPAKEPERKSGKPAKPTELDFTGINFEGRLRTPQLLYFLDRAAEELERASLERRSFIPEMVRTIDEESL
jgi:hypothetical protein